MMAEVFLSHTDWHRPTGATIQPGYCRGFSLRTVPQGGWWWSMTSGIWAGYLSPALPLPPLMVIYPLWVSVLPAAALKAWVAPANDDHWLSGRKTSVCWVTNTSLSRLHSFRLPLCILFPSESAVYDESNCKCRFSISLQVIVNFE